MLDFHTTNIEHMTGSTSGFNFWTWASSIASAAFGYYLSTVNANRKEKKQIKRIGEQFQQEVESLETSVIKQKVAVTNYIASLNGGKKEFMHLFLSYKLKRLQDLDRHDVIKSYEGKKPEHLKFVTAIYSNMEVLDEIAKDLEEESDTYRETSNTLNHEYLNLLHKIQLANLKFRRTLKPEEIAQQTELLLFEQLINKYFNTEITPDYVISLLPTFHKELHESVFVNARNEHFNLVNEYALASNYLAGRMKAAKVSYLYNLKKMETSLVRIYKKMYSKNMDTTPFENTDFTQAGT